MSNSLKDALLGLGFKSAPEAPKPPRPPRPEAKPAGANPHGRPRHDAKPRHGERPGGAPSRPPHDRPPQGRPPQGRPPHASKPASSKPAGPRPEFDLGKAYALRAQQEKDERIAAEAAKQEEARLRREARAKLAVLLEGKALNDPAAEHARHFEYGGKIKRVHVTPEQLVALNKGELGVVQSEGRYLLVTAEVLVQVKDVFAPAIALEVDPNAPTPAGDYADPQFQIPDDLVW
jgi:uncharacterized protein YaiL (DUF2058 family)